MDSSTQRGQVLDLAGVLASEHEPDEVLTAALPLLLELAGAAAALVFSRTAEGLQLTGHAGLELAADGALERWTDPTPEPQQLSTFPVPDSWRTQGITRVASHPLPGEARLLALAWTRTTDDPEVLALAIEDPTLRDVISPSTGAIAATIAFSFGAEHAVTLTDAIMRRSMIGYGADAGFDALDGAARVARETLGWEQSRVDAGIMVHRHYMQRFLPRDLKDDMISGD